MSSPSITVWSFMNYISFPLSILTLVMLMSGIQLCERVAHNFCKIRISLGPVGIRLVVLIILLSLGLFAIESATLHEMSLTKPQSYNDMTSELHFKKQLWRHQRNWWIVATNMFAWIVAWRTSSIIRSFRTELVRAANKKVL